jgi:hypothetical protein
VAGVDSQEEVEIAVVAIVEASAALAAVISAAADQAGVGKLLNQLT